MKDKVGLDIGSLKDLNLALTSEWWWRFHTKIDPLWKKFIIALRGWNKHLGALRH